MTSTISQLSQRALKKLKVFCLFTKPFCVGRKLVYESD